MKIGKYKLAVQACDYAIDVNVKVNGVDVDGDATNVHAHVNHNIQVKALYLRSKARDGVASKLSDNGNGEGQAYYECIQDLKLALTIDPLNGDVK